MTVEAHWSGSSRASSRKEARRRNAVRAVFFIFLLSLIEGPLRKWFLPGLGAPLTLLRDPFVLLLYAYCFLNGLVLGNRLAKLWLSFAIVTSLVGLLQYLLSGWPVETWALGVRTYWLYMPMAFIVAKCFTREDVHRFFKLCLWISIPYALLVATQYNSPSNAFVNLGVGGDEEGSVGLKDGILRPFGLFTYTGPNVQFTAFLIAVFVAVLVEDVRMRHRMLFLLVSGAAIGSMSVLTGSRSIYFLAAIIGAVTLVGLLGIRPTWTNVRRSLMIAGFGGLAGLLFVYAFPDMLDAMAIRFKQAERVEGSIWIRAFSGLFGWVDALFTASVLGAGLGAGAPGVARYIGLPPLLFGESDMQRNVNELGLVLGVLMIVLRYWTAYKLVSNAFALAARNLTSALPIAGFAFPPMFSGQLTHSPISGYLVWLALGIVVASRRHVNLSIPSAGAIKKS